ncbi:MAG: aspartate-alanine antiporter [Bacillota bacterium]
MFFIHYIFSQNPIIALLLSVGIGSWIGKIKFGNFQLGGVAGSLLAAVIVSQAGVVIGADVKNLMFALFIYAVGFQSGPKFFSALNKSAIKEIVLAIFVAVASLATVVVCAKLFHLDQGLAAGVAAGALTQSSIIGTAGDAIGQLGLSASETARLQGNVAIGYAVTYIFGTLLAIIMCTDVLQVLLRRNIRNDALEMETQQNKHLSLKLFGNNSQHFIQDFMARVFQVKASLAGKSIADLESEADYALVVEKLKRGDKILTISPDLKLAANDLILVTGVRNFILKCPQTIGDLVYQAPDDMDFTFETRKVIFTNKTIQPQTWQAIKAARTATRYHGVYVIGVTRMDDIVELTDATILKHGDVIELYGSATDINRVASEIGYVVASSPVTDYVYLGLGMVLGLLVGMIEFKLKGIPITLGSGGGALLGGLVFGWIHAKRPKSGNIPIGGLVFLKDFGLSAFVAAVGLSAGLQAYQTIIHSGIEIFVAGLIVTIVPLLLATLFGWYVLRYRNIAFFAGALSGSRSANPAFGSLLEKAGNSVPTLPFAITYAIANILLTLLGPLIVAFV